MSVRIGGSAGIDTERSRAICDEIAYRLRNILRLEVGNELPPRLRFLLEQIALADSEAVPSIVPSIDEMIAVDEPIMISARVASASATPADDWRNQQPLNWGSRPS